MLDDEHPSVGKHFQFMKAKERTSAAGSGVFPKRRRATALMEKVWKKRTGAKQDWTQKYDSHRTGHLGVESGWAELGTRAL